MPEYYLVSSWEEFKLLKNDWISLADKINCWIYQDYQFLESIHKCINPYHKLTIAIVVYKENNSIKGVLPLCVYRKKNIRILAWMGSLNLMDHGEILFDNTCNITLDDFITNAIQLIKKNIQYDVSYFGKILANSPSYQYFNKNHHQIKTYKNGFIHLQNNFETYLEELKQNRKNLKTDTLRQIKRISEKGSLEFEVIQKENKNHVISVTDELINQKKDIYKNTFWSNKEYRDIIVHQSLNLPHSHLSCLKLNQKIIAAHFGYIYKDTYTFFVPSYNSEFATYSPGRLMIYFLIKYCYDNKIHYFDFGMGEESYKFEWSNVITNGASFIGNGIWGKMIRGYTHLGGKL